LIILPDESCRKCGGLLLEYTVCAKCKAPVQFICRICGALTLQRYHIDFCFIEDNDGTSRRKIALKNFLELR